MGKAHILQSNFSGGEMDPKRRGQVDLPRYHSSLATCRNFYLFVGGGGTRRAGLKFIEDEGAGAVTRLIPFTIFKKDASPAVLQGYIIEFKSNNTIDFYTNGAKLAASVTSPFTNADLGKIRYEQFDNALYLVHPDFPPQKLTRTNDTTWGISAVSFTQPATPHWDGTTGYPTAITFFEQRMILAGTKAQPQTIWGSETGVITNFVTGTGDSDPFKFVVAVATSNIYHLAASKQIHILTYDKEVMLQGGAEKALTPTNFQIKEMTGYGVREKVRPLFVGSEFLFATRHGKKLRASAYRYDSDSWAAPDMSLWSAHLANLGIVEMVHQKEPVSIIWIVVADGRLLSITYDKDQEVVGWTQHTTDGLFKSIAVIPYSDTDQVWVSVERTIGATAKTFIEVFDPALYTDSAVTGTDGPGKATWTGLSHLNGKTVDILADGVVMPPQIVASGQITLPRNANAVEIGLHFTSTITDLPPEIPTAVGTAQGQAISVNRCIVRLHESVGCTINGETIPFREFGTGVLDEPVAPFSGDKDVRTLGWESKGVVTIEQTQPLPFTVLAIVKEITVNG